MTAFLLYRASTSATKPTTTTAKGSALSNLEIDGNFRSLADSINNFDIENATSGTLPVIRGGTGSSIAPISGGVVYGSSGVYTSTPVGTAGQVLVSNGASAPTWQSITTDINIVDDTATNATRYLTFTDQTSGAENTLGVSSSKLTFNPNTGNLTAAGSVVGYSDARLKTDLVKITGAVAKVEQLNGYTFTRTDTGERQTGVLAQEVQKVLPEVVINTESDYLGVAYGNMVGLLIEAIKELNEEIKRLKGAE